MKMEIGAAMFKMRRCFALLPLIVEILVATPNVTAKSKTKIESLKAFVQVPTPENLDIDWKQHLCHLLPQPCRLDGLRLYRSKGSASASNLVLVSATPLIRAEVFLNNESKWQIISILDLREYAHSATALVNMGKERRTTLEPELVRVEQGWAIPVVSTAIEEYWGGGGRWAYTDFVVPLGPGKGFFVARDHVPSSCYRMMRQCTGSAKQRYCHVEMSGDLQIDSGTSALSKLKWNVGKWDANWRTDRWKYHTTKIGSTGLSKRAFCEHEI